MTKRRSRGDGGLHWDKSRQRWIATASLGYNDAGKRVVRHRSGRTKTEALNKLKEVLREHEDGLAVAPGDYTVKDAVENWLSYGLKAAAATKDEYRILIRLHIYPRLGTKKLRDLTADHVDQWLEAKASELSTRTLRGLHSFLNRSVKRAMARDKVKRNVVELCAIPDGRPGRPSKALTLVQAESVLNAISGDPMEAYITVSLLTGARTEELRPLRWANVDLEGDPTANPPIPPHVAVWRSVRAGGETKTRKSRRTLALGERCRAALRQQRRKVEEQRTAAGDGWKDNDLVFPTEVGTVMDAANTRRAFRRAIAKADCIDPRDWTPRELRHSFVSLLSDKGLSSEEISKLVGHSSSTTTERVYRHQIRPVIRTGATAMDELFQG